MVPPVNKLGHQPDVIALIIFKGTDVTSVRRDSRVTAVISVLRGLREMIASFAPPDSRVTTARNVPKTTTGLTVVICSKVNTYLLFNVNNALNEFRNIFLTAKREF